MKYLPFVFSHLRQNKIRTASTVLAAAICLFFLGTLQSVLAEVDARLRASSPARLVVRNAVSLVLSLPSAYATRLQSVPGVRRVSARTGLVVQCRQAAVTLETPSPTSR